MKYRESSIDKKIRNLFSQDVENGNLRRITLKSGSLRGLAKFEMEFNYPITAIAGRNGAGKSTILAMACCAFHNGKNGYKIPSRRLPYYTFSDFFTQHTQEVPPQGIEIRYYIAYGRWKKTEALPEGKGIGFQRRWKRKGGKWNDYHGRVNRNVIFLGIERIVPHSERSQSRSYSKVFREQVPQGWEDKVKDAVGYILGKSYGELKYWTYSKYALPMVGVGGLKYSGLNMGAGENALFEIFKVIYSCDKGALIVIDEIELGLHCDAQKKLIKRLKDACAERSIQIICTTHSKDIFDSLPPDGRYYIESLTGKTKVTAAISSEFAMSKMGDNSQGIYDVLVEDNVAKSLLSAVVPSDVRARINFIEVGSASALSRQLAASYVRDPGKKILAIFDGDQRSLQRDNVEYAKKMIEKRSDGFEDWFSSKVNYLPGDTWPESWIIQKNKAFMHQLSLVVNCDEDQLPEIIEYALQAGKHNEFYELAKNLGYDRDTCLQLLSANIAMNDKGDFDDVMANILEYIE